MPLGRHPAFPVIYLPGSARCPAATTLPPATTGNAEKLSHLSEDNYRISVSRATNQCSTSFLGNSIFLQKKKRLKRIKRKVSFHVAVSEYLYIKNNQFNNYVKANTEYNGLLWKTLWFS